MDENLNSFGFPRKMDKRDFDKVFEADVINTFIHMQRSRVSQDPRKMLQIVAQNGQILRSLANSADYLDEGELDAWDSAAAAITGAMACIATHN